MRIIFILPILLILISSKVAAQRIDAVKNADLPYQFWIHYPEGYNENPTKKFPFILSLHGRSLSGTDLEKVKNYGIIYEILRGMKLEFVVVAPQCQNGWDNKKLIQILDYAEKNYRIDKSRIYLTGMSMGGYGAWLLAGEYPGRFAAVSPVCGGGRTSDANNLKSLPQWVFHGAKDNAVPISESEKMVSAIKAAGNKKIEFTVYKDLGHDLTGVFRNRALYDWFLKYTIEGIKTDEILPPPLEKQKQEEPVAKVTEIKKEENPEIKPQTDTIPFFIDNQEKEKPTTIPVTKEEEPVYIAFEEPKQLDDTPKKETAVEKTQTGSTLTKKKPYSKKKWWEFWKWKFWEQLK
jgi:hypothetical protein